MNNDHVTPLEEVLHQITTEESELTHAALMRWVQKHPEYRDELTDYFATRAVHKSAPAMSPDDEARAGQLMVSKALNYLYKQQAAQVSEASPVKAMRLCDAIKASGLSEEEFATQCRLDDLIVAKLDRRLIRILSIPTRLFELIANALDQAADDVRDMLTGEPIPLRSYKARNKPEVKVEDFAEAVRASNLPDNAKAEWLSAAASEHPSGRSE